MPRHARPSGTHLIWLVAVPAALLLLLVGGLVATIELYLYEEYSHQHNTECRMSQCAVRTRLCGTGCGRSGCNNTLCLDVVAALELPEIVTTSNWTGTYTMVSSDGCLLLTPPPCAAIVPEWVDVLGHNDGIGSVPCFYDDRHPASTLTVSHQTPEASSTAIAVLTVESGLCFVALMWLMVGCTLICHH